MTMLPENLTERRQAARQRLDLVEAGQPSRLSKWMAGRAGIPVEIVRPVGPPPVAFYVILAVVVVFVMLGLVMVLSSTAANAVGSEGSPYRIFRRQATWALIGVFGLVAGARIPFERWRPLVFPIAIVSAALMFLPFMTGIGATINDTRAWARFGDISLQPSEVLKLALLALTADWLTRNSSKLDQVRVGIVPVIVIAGGGSFLCLVQGDFGSAVVLGSIMVSVGFVGGVPIHHLSSFVGASLVGLGLLAISSPRRMNRLTAFLDIRGNREYSSYQTYQGHLSMANGGLTGSGIGGSNGKLGYLPLPHSDFIFAVIADELGFIGSVAVIGGFAVIVWFGVQTALAAPNRFSMLMAGGISAWFGLQAAINLGGVSGVLPVTGLTLPLFSAGGTSLFVMMTASGLLLNVARRAR
jgi:cell division protein FtsW